MSHTLATEPTVVRDGGVHRTYVGHVERGETTPTLYSIVRFAVALDVDAGELVHRLRP